MNIELENTIKRLEEEVNKQAKIIQWYEKENRHNQEIIIDLSKRITKAIEKLHCWGEVLDPEFQQEMLKILEGDNDEKEKIKMNDEEFRDWYFETLREKAYKLRPYYDIDKVKAYGVYVWSKEDENGDHENVFDICDEEIIFWTDDHTIIEEAKPIVEDIQHFLWKYYDTFKERMGVK